MDGHDLGPEKLAILVPLFGIATVFGLPIVGWIVVRLLAHRERMAMIRAGMVPGTRFGKHASGVSGPGYGSEPSSPSRYERDLSDPQRLLRKGITLTFIGMALTIGLSFIGLGEGNGHSVLGPWLLGGLIPLFIGLAQVTIAVVTDPQLFAGLMRRQPPSVPPPARDWTSGGEGPPPYDGPYTYRPGSTQELRPPRPPVP